jgi:hypothetical protein
MLRMNNTFRAKFIPAMSPVLIAANIKNDVGSHKIRRVEGLFHIREAEPSGTLRNPIPVIHSATSQRMLRMVLWPTTCTYDRHNGPKMDRPLKSCSFVTVFVAYGQTRKRRHFFKPAIQF